jgi:hypothetical protein
MWMLLYGYMDIIHGPIEYTQIWTYRLLMLLLCRSGVY